MKVLLDENIPHDLRHLLPGHEVFTVAYMGWSSFENGELLAIAEQNGFKVMVTRDSGVQYEQHLPTIPISVVILDSRTGKLEDLRPMIPNLLLELERLKPRSVIRLA